MLSNKNNLWVLFYYDFPLLILTKDFFYELKNFYNINKFKLLNLLDKNQFKYNLFIEKKIYFFFDNIIFNDNFLEDFILIRLDLYLLIKNYSHFKDSFFNFLFILLLNFIKNLKLNNVNFFILKSYFNYIFNILELYFNFKLNVNFLLNYKINNFYKLKKTNYIEFKSNIIHIKNNIKLIINPYLLNYSIIINLLKKLINLDINKNFIFLIYLIFLNNKKFKLINLNVLFLSKKDKKWLKNLFFIQKKSFYTFNKLKYKEFNFLFYTYVYNIQFSNNQNYNYILKFLLKKFFNDKDVQELLFKF